MDYYDILGIRPSASATEIELAYKGRRSQYHPDRYAASDSETVAWATVKMQEVNEAYSALVNPDTRARFDQRSGTKTHQATPPAQGRKASANAGDGTANAERRAAHDAASVLLRPDWDWQIYDKVHARPNIPQKKLAGAISSYAFGVSPADVMVLLDDTVFGGAKEGLLVTSDAIYCKQKFEDPVRMPFNEIKRVAAGADSTMLINDYEFFKAFFIEHLAIGNFSSRLAKVFEQPASNTEGKRAASESSASPSGVDLMWRLHLGAMEALRTEMDGEVMLIDELINRQMMLVGRQFPNLLTAVENNPIFSHLSAEASDAEAAQLALVLFLILHYYAFSKLPSGFKGGMGDDIAYLYAFSEIYKIAFQEKYQSNYGKEPSFSEEDLLMMSAMFFHRDGAGNFELKIPREEALFLLLENLQVSSVEARGLMCGFEDIVEWWYNAFNAMRAEEDD